MELSIIDRLLLIDVLPSKGNEFTLLTKRDLVDKLRIQEDEQDAIEIQKGGAVMLKDAKKATEDKKEFELTTQEKELVFGELDGMNKDSQLDEKYLDLYLLFKKA